MAVNYRIHHDQKARVIYAASESAIVEETLLYVRDARSAVSAYFCLIDDLPLINVFLAPSRAEYDHLVKHLTATPTSQMRLSQPQALDVYILSPRAYRKDAPAFVHEPLGYDPQEYGRLICHEMMHVLEEAISPRGAMERRPAWFTEGLAVQVSGQYKEEEFLARLKELMSRPMPKTADIKGASTYVLGWTLVRYLQETFGRQRVLEVMRQDSSGEILEAFGADVAQTPQSWRDWALRVFDKSYFS